MRFLFPEQLFWCFGLVALFAFALFRREQSRKAFSAWIQPELKSRLLLGFDPSLSLKKSGLRFFALFFLLLALAQPQWGFREEKYRALGSDLFLVLDLSLSMETEDVPPSRIQKTKHWLRSLLGELQGQRVGLVSFAGAADLVAPLTTDMAYVDEKLSEASPTQFLAQGTDIGLALKTSLSALERGAEAGQDGAAQEASSSQAVAGSQAILLISDGEDQELAALKIAEKIKKSGIRFFVIGVGTEKGGPIPIKDAQGNSIGFKRSRTGGELIMSQFKPDFLRDLAKLGGGKFWKASLDQTEIGDVIQELGLLNTKSGDEKTVRIYREWFQLPLFLGLLFLLLELFLARSKEVPILALCFFFLLPPSGPAFAGSSRAPFGAYRKNQDGIEQSKLGSWPEAEQSFNQAQALSPESPEIEFNRGVSQFEQKKGKEAIQSFQNALQLAEAKGDMPAAAKAAYNLAKAYEQEGRRREATQAYQKAIAGAQRTRDEELERKARKNIELLPPPERKQPPKPQDDKEKKKPKDKPEDKQKDKPEDKQQNSKDKQEGQEKDNQQKDQKKDKNQGKSQEQADKKSENDSPEKDPKKDPKPDKGKEKDKEKESKSKSEKPEKQKPEDSPGGAKAARDDFHSEKLSPEDAEQVLSDLIEKEKELHQRLKRRGKQVKTNDKDW